MDVLFFSTIADQITKEINHNCDLNISQTRLLLFFDETANKPLAMGKLAKSLNISLSTLSRQLQQKKTRDFIEITRSEKDSSKIVNLSKTGMAKVSELKATLNGIEGQLFDHFSKTTLTSFVQQLHLVADSSACLEKTE